MKLYRPSVKETATGYQEFHCLAKLVGGLNSKYLHSAHIVLPAPELHSPLIPDGLGIRGYTFDVLENITNVIIGDFMGTEVKKCEHGFLTPFRYSMSVELYLI
jgi:hypothetical protein